MWSFVNPYDRLQYPNDPVFKVDIAECVAIRCPELMDNIMSY